MLFIGHSHIRAPYAAAQKLNLNPKALILNPFQEIAGQINTFSDYKTPIILNLFGADFLWCVNNPHAMNFFITNEDAIDGQILPTKVVYEYTKVINSIFGYPDAISKIRSILDNLKIKDDVYHLSHPPPIYWDGITSNSISLVVKVFKIMNDIRKDICNSNNIVFIDPPKESILDDGFLKPSLAQDAGHGNLDYGLCVINQLQAMGVL